MDPTIRRETGEGALEHIFNSGVSAALGPDEGGQAVEQRHRGLDEISYLRRLMAGTG